MSDHERIFLGPACDPNRLWCQDQVFEDCEGAKSCDGTVHEPVCYVRADLYEALQSRLSSESNRADSEFQRAEAYKLWSKKSGVRECADCGLQWIGDFGDCPQCCRVLHRNEAAQHCTQAMENGARANDLSRRLSSCELLLRDWRRYYEDGEHAPVRRTVEWFAAVERGRFETCGAMFPPGQFAVQVCTLPRGHVGEHENNAKGL